MSKLFQPLKVGNLTLQSRLVMAPLTRFRADDSHVPLPIVSKYYEQRAVIPGTLLITEATFIAPRAGGNPNVPGIWSAEQITQWKETTSKVHAAGSYIYLQLWALGRAADADVLRADSGFEVQSASDVPIAGGSQPHSLSEEEILEYIQLYTKAAKNAIEAGFDGVEIHGANGYLIDQFLQDVSNKRTDRWGGSIENRARFALEVAKSISAAVGPERTAIRLSPYSKFQDMGMQDPVPQFSYLAQELKKLSLSYLHVVESRVSGNSDTGNTQKIDFLLDIWGKTSPVFIAGGFTAESAYKAADEEYADKDIAIVFGRYWIANPDLVYRVKNKLAFRPYDRSVFYTPKKELGYITYTNSHEFEAEKASKI